jgi:hypothetical protein
MPLYRLFGVGRMNPDSLFKGKKNALKKQKIYDLLQENIQLSTSEVLNKLNSSLKWGVTMNEVMMLLSRTKQFEKIGYVETYTKGGRRFRGCLWGLNYE